MKRTGPASDDDFADGDGQDIVLSDDDEHLYVPSPKTSPSQHSSSSSSQSHRKKTRQTKLVELDPIEDSMDDSSDDMIDKDEVPDGGSGSRNSFCGTISCVELQNFMCHQKFSIDLNPRVNFIVGRNGSGKSAILIALQFLLNFLAQI